GGGGGRAADGGEPDAGRGDRAGRALAGARLRRPDRAADHGAGDRTAHARGGAGTGNPRAASRRAHDVAPRGADPAGADRRDPQPARRAVAGGEGRRAMDQAQRATFYEGQYLGAADLTAVVDYGRVQHARHLLGAHTWGIAMGLELDERPDPAT